MKKGRFHQSWIFSPKSLSEVGLWDVSVLSRRSLNVPSRTTVRFIWFYMARIKT
jgi:hypothetical protein